jgi:aminopeptidase N
MEDAWVEMNPARSGGALAQFKLWYSEPGTPRLRVASRYDAREKAYTLTVIQEPPQVKGASGLPLHIPVKIALLDSEGHELPLQFVGDKTSLTNDVLHIKKAREEFVFTAARRPTPSILRNFSAPVHLQYNYSDADLALLLRHDRDPFNQWEAGQRLLTNGMLALIADYQAGRPLALAEDLVELFRPVLTPGFHDDAAFISQIMTLPGENYLAEKMTEIDVPAIHEVREFVRREFGRQLAAPMGRIYRDYRPGPYSYSPEMAGRRRLKNLCLSYMLAADVAEARAMCRHQFETADNMTDELSALTALVHHGCPESGAALSSFYEKWQQQTLVVDKWFTLQATAPLPHTLARVRELARHPRFTIKNPNKVRALIGSFAAANPICFHDVSGAGYELLGATVLELDPLNPAIAARLLGRLSRWRRYTGPQQNLMQAQLKMIIDKGNLSKGVYEVAAKSLEPLAQE